MPPPTRDDPLHAFAFQVEIDGFAKAMFRSVTGLGSETEIVEYRNGADRATRKLPGRTRFDNIVMQRGLTTNADLWNWRQSVVDGNVQRRNGVIILLDDKLQAVLRWQFTNGWPSKWEGPELDASKNEVAIETVEIAHEGLSLVT